VVELRNANIIKALLIDFIEKENLIENCLYGNEVFYGTKKRQADLIVLNGYVTAFEIKSMSDDFRRIREQLNDYGKVFDYNYLVTTKCHEEKANRVINDKEGLIILNDDKTFVIKRKSKLQIEQSKSEILDTIPLVFLKKHFKVKGPIKSVTELKKSLIEFSLNDLRIALRYFLKERLGPRNKIFFEEKGINTHFEDLKLLTRNNDQIL
jgi:hypothetical protein